MALDRRRALASAARQKDDALDQGAEYSSEDDAARSARPKRRDTASRPAGKSTTLYASLREIDAYQSNIITVEDPVEYQMPGVGQIEVRPKIGLTFASALRSILRQDPDVILVGEIRDHETAEMAVHASLTGHLVFSTLHTNDSSGAVTRLVDMGVEPYLVASTLQSVMGTRLVRTICEQCRAPVAPEADQLGLLGWRSSRPRWTPSSRRWVWQMSSACQRQSARRKLIWELRLTPTRGRWRRLTRS